MYRLTESKSIATLEHVLLLYPTDVHSSFYLGIKDFLLEYQKLKHIPHT